MKWRWNYAEARMALVPCGAGCRSRGEHAHCLGCGYSVALTEKWCSECTCEEDGP
jgi:hypothetical protein